MSRHPLGFTLVEIAIVLVIIALLLGGVLKGKELMTSAKIRNVANDFNAIAAGIYGYQDRFKALPGDDSGASARWGSGIPDGNRDGSIAGEFCTASNVASESVYLWHHLRLAGLIAADGEQISNAAGGIFGVQTGTGNTGAPELAGTVVCASNLNGKIAAALDAQLDDGKPQSGTLRAYSQNGQTLVRGCATNVTRAPAVRNTTGYNADEDSELYTLCRAL